MKILSVIILMFIICSSVFATPVIGGKLNYPESTNVEPRVNIDDFATLNAGIENTIDVSLDDCIKLALGNNPRIQSAMQDVFASDTRLKQVWSNYFPQFSWQSGYSRIRQLQLSDVFQENLIYNFWVLGQISASQLLYDFGVTRNQAKIRKLDNLAYMTILTATLNDVIYNVKDAYYNLLYAIEVRRVAEENIEQYVLVYNQAKAFYKAGERSKVDVTMSQVNLSNAKLTYIQAQNAVKTAMAKLNNVIGIPYNTKYNLTDKLSFDICDIDLESAIKLTEESRPEFKLAEVKVEQAKQNVNLAKKNWYPQLIAQGQFEVGGRQLASNYGYTFGAYINFPTINGMLLKYQIREAKDLYAKEQANALNTKNNLYFEVQNAYYLLDEKKNKIPVARLGMQHAKENYELSLGRYSVGVGNPVELNDAQYEYDNSRLTYYKIMYEYNSAKAYLEKSVGRNLLSADSAELIKN